MGPEILRAGKGLDVAPHPHIGLATVTYLFEGEFLHSDSLGLPLLYVIALQRENDEVSFPVEGFDGGSISMLSVQIG